MTDAAGGVIAAPADEAAEMMARMHGVEILDVPRDEPISEPVMIDGAQVGVVALRFPSSHLPTPERQARDAIARTIVVGGVLATAVAVVVAVFIARQVTAPVSALTAAAVAFESGRREVRVNRPDAPGELGALSAAFDRMAAAVEHEDRLRRQLVADVAHEVRTPLTVIRATSEGLVDGALPATQATFESLHEEVLRLTQLVADLEILAAADAAGLHLDRAPIDLADIAADAVAAVTALTSEQNVALTTELAPAPTVGDERRIRQIISNIVLNALHYAPPGSPIRVEAGHLPNGGAFARVTDTGSGLSDEDIAHVFDRFYRGSAAAGTEGSGIGLAIGSELAGAHGGSLTAENAPDGGAVFTLTLPPIRPT